MQVIKIHLEGIAITKSIEQFIEFVGDFTGWRNKPTSWSKSESALFIKQNTKHKNDNSGQESQPMRGNRTGANPPCRPRDLGFVSERCPKQSTAKC